MHELPGDKYLISPSSGDGPDGRAGVTSGHQEAGQQDRGKLRELIQTNRNVNWAKMSLCADFLDQRIEIHDVKFFVAG
jgi:hypothetical protein